MKKALFFAISACLLKLSGYGQDNRYAISLNYIQGLKAFSSFNTPFRGSYNGGEVAYHLFVDSVGWARKLSVSDIELQASYLNLQHITFGSPAEPNGLMGNHYSLAAGLNVLVAKWGTVSWMFSPGLGLLYAPKNFYTTNNQNFVIGSKLNVFVYARTKVVVPVSPGVSLEGGACISHTSNGSLSFPNDGFDNISAFAGVLVDFDKEARPTRKQRFEVAGDQFEITATFGGRSEEKTGYTKNTKTNTGYYADTAIQHQTPLIKQANLLLGYTHHLSPLFSVTVGKDAAYYLNTFSWNNFFKTYEGSYTTYGRFSLGVTAGVDLWLGRLVFSAGAGCYVFDHFFYPDTRFYAPVGIKYFITPHIALQGRAIINEYSSLGVSIGFH
jgi:hypothetical protein